MEKFKSKTVFSLGVIVLITILLVPWAQPASTAAEIELKFGALNPESSFMAKVCKSWMAKVEKETNGRVHFTAYWGGTLITPTDAPMEVEKGVVDVATFSSDYPKVGFDLVKNTGTFYFGVPSPEAQARIFLELRKKFPQLDAEYSQYGKILANDSTLAPQLLQTRKPVRSVQDLKGLKIKTIPAYISLLKDLGAEAVMMSMFDVYLAIQKSTIDGVLGPWDTFVPLKFFEVIKSITLINLTYAPQSGLLMGWKRWNSLPPDIQKVLENNMKFYSDENLRFIAEARDDALGVAKKVGTEIIELPKDEIKKIDDAVYKESLKKATELDAKGLPGTPMLNEIRRLIKEYK